MIDKTSIEELKLISSISPNLIHTDPLVMAKTVKLIAYDAILDAIKSSNDIDVAIKYIIVNHFDMFECLMQVVKEHYSNKLSYIEKIAILK